MLLLFLACAGSNADAEPPEDTAETEHPVGPRVTSLADAAASFYGGPSYGVGNAVAFAGDEDGDGADVAVVVASFAGLICVVRGPPDSGSRPIGAADACFTAEADLDYAGQALDGGRDLTGDGVPDLLVGAIGSDDAGPESGKTYLLPGPLTGGLLGDADVMFVGESKSDYSGSAVVLLGDIDGDGAEDLAIGAPANEGGGNGAGKAYVFRGPFEARTTGLGEADAEVVGEGPAALLHGAPAAGDGVGSVLARAGDVDGDGLSDLLLGANGDESGGADAGAAAVFLGPVADGAVPLADADRLWIGDVPAQVVGDSVAGVGDLDGDGRDDVLVGGDTGAAGSTWLVLGTDGSGPISGASVRFDGEALGDMTGSAAAGAGDTDGDGWRDLVIGAYGRDAPAWEAPAVDVGAVYLLHGPFSAGVVSVGTAREVWLGARPSGEAGRALAGGGDMDGDGLPDLLVGAIYADTGGAYGGEAYVILDL